MDEIIFASTDIEELKADSKALVEEILDRKLSESDPLILFLYSLLSIIVQQRAIINFAGNQNLLAFAIGYNLECLGELVGVSRLPASAAICTCELTLTTARAKETVIPAGTRVSTADNVHFKLVDDVIFLSGETVKTAQFVCTAEGEVGNGFLIGEINRIVDPAPYLKTISNVTISEGGADIESDDDLRERIRLAPSSFSVAGSQQAYEFWAKQAHNLVSDVKVTSPEPGFVDVFILLEGGEIPGAEILNHIQEYLSDEKIRPLTDFLTVKPAEVLNYDVDVKYWINRADATQALSIKTAAENAVADFISWQKNKLGRDVNPTELYFRLRQAGVKRAEINFPAFAITPPNAVAICQNFNLQYGGLEDE